MAKLDRLHIAGTRAAGGAAADPPPHHVFQQQLEPRRLMAGYGNSDGFATMRPQAGLL